jgi:hypothetical protein
MANRTLCEQQTYHPITGSAIGGRQGPRASVVVTTCPAPESPPFPHRKNSRRRQSQRPHRNNAALPENPRTTPAAEGNCPLCWFAADPAISMRKAKAGRMIFGAGFRYRVVAHRALASVAFSARISWPSPTRFIHAHPSVQGADCHGAAKPSPAPQPSQ